MFIALNGWRFIFALMIVWLHMPIWKPDNADLGNPIVTFFFILSGFLITIAYRDPLLNKTITAKDFIIKRCATIFPLQWLFTLLFVICSINVVSYWAIPFHLTLTQSLIPLWEIDFTLNTPSWFLSSIFVCYLLTPPILGWLKNRNAIFILYVIALLLWNLFLFSLPETIGRRWLCYISPFARLFDYGNGIILALYWPEIKKLFNQFLGADKIRHTLLELWAIFLISISLFNIPILGLNRFLGIGSEVLNIFICVFISVYCLSDGFISKILKYPIFNRLGDISIAIYMCHTFVIHFTDSLLNKSLVLYLVVSIISIIIFSVILDKYYCNHMKKSFINLCVKSKNCVVK